MLSAALRAAQRIRRAKSKHVAPWLRGWKMPKDTIYESPIIFVGLHPTTWFDFGLRSALTMTFYSGLFQKPTEQAKKAPQLA
jgi:hypothetical protein